MDWEPYMEMAIKNQETLQELMQELLKWQRGQRSANPHQASGIEVMLSNLQLNPQQSHQLVATVLYQQVEFNKAVIAMLTDLDNRKSEPGTSG